MSDPIIKPHGKCQICGTTHHLVVDRDPTTDDRRGVLCQSCHVLVTVIQEASAYRTERALTYLGRSAKDRDNSPETVLLPLTSQGWKYQDIALRLGLHPSTVSKWINRGYIPTEYLQPIRDLIET